ncbi:hypothetical protein SUGI_0920460 [Cryptomeria japonica]|nr:hypothetical protein SUGI_0920460 [Cryptomeria japonica]
MPITSPSTIGASFIIKKKGLERAGALGPRAGLGGYTYLLEPLCWIGMITTYVFAPAVLVTPLGALSIIVSVVLAHFMLKETLHKMRMLGYLMCIVGSTIIVIHAPQELSVDSVTKIWYLATRLGHEYKGHGNHHKTHYRGNKPASLPCNMVLYNGGNYMCDNATQLFKQGILHKGHFQEFKGFPFSLEDWEHRIPWKIRGKRIDLSRLSFAQGNVLVSTHLLLKAIFCAGQRSSFHTLTAQGFRCIFTTSSVHCFSLASLTARPNLCRILRRNGAEVRSSSFL